MKIILTIILTDLFTNSLLSSFCSFLQTKNKNQVFSNLVVWYRAIFLVFCLRRVALYFKAMPNSIDFYKGIFLDVIRVRIVVSWNEQFKINKVVRCFNLKFSHVVWMAYHHIFTHVMSLADKILFYKLGKDFICPRLSELKGGLDIKELY